MNQFLYNIHYKVEAMEQWAATVNDAVTDHAEHIDLAKTRSFQAFMVVRDQVLLALEDQRKEAQPTRATHAGSWI